MTEIDEIGNEISTAAFWAQPASARAASWARLRAEAPVSFQPAAEFGTIPSTRGYWAVTTVDDVTHVSRNADVFCSGQGVNIEELPPEVLETGASFLVMDAPRHTKIRGIVSRAFTPRRIAELDAAINAKSEEIVRNFAEAGGGAPASCARAMRETSAITTVNATAAVHLQVVGPIDAPRSSPPPLQGANSVP